MLNRYVLFGLAREENLVKQVGKIRIMITIKQILLALLVAGCLSSASSTAIAKDGTSSASSVAGKLSNSTVLELPAIASQLVAKASKSNKQQVALEVVSVVAKTNPELLPSVGAAVISEIPSAAAKVASAAVQLAPERLFEIAKAAAVSAPKKAEDVALALAAIQPKELLKICLAIAKGAPSEAGRVIIPIARAFPMESHLVYSGLAHGAPEQEPAITDGLLKALPGLQNTAFGEEVRKSRSGVASIITTIKRKVAIVNKTLDVVTELAKKLEKTFNDAAAASGTSTATTVSGFAKSLLSGAITVDTTTGEVKIDATKLDPNSAVGKEFAKQDVLADFVASATDDVKTELGKQSSQLNQALSNATKEDIITGTEDVITVILSQDTVRPYNQP